MSVREYHSVSREVCIFSDRTVFQRDSMREEFIVDFGSAGLHGVFLFSIIKMIKTFLHSSTHVFRASLYFYFY